MRARALAALGIGAMLALASAAPVAADSLVFIRDSNVWLSNPDGSGQYQVTLDGTATSPYESPSQPDGGTVMAIRPLPVPPVRWTPGCHRTGVSWRTGS